MSHSGTPGRYWSIENFKKKVPEVRWGTMHWTSNGKSYRFSANIALTHPSMIRRGVYNLGCNERTQTHHSLNGDECHPRSSLHRRTFRSILCTTRNSFASARSRTVLFLIGALYRRRSAAEIQKLVYPGPSTRY